MLELKNKTPLSAELLPALDKNGYDYVIVIIKAKFNILPNNASLVFSDEPVDIHKSDQYFEKPGQSSIRYGTDISLNKQSTDIVVNGHAYAPPGKSVHSLDVSVEFSGQNSRCRIFGDRYWEKNGLSWEHTQPRPFKRMPLKYEYSFGGSWLHDDEEIVAAFDANPVGRGFVKPQAKEPKAGFALPNIEDPQALIRRWQDQPFPAGYGFICPDWHPRKLLSGTYDDEWQLSRMPLLPLDFDDRFFSSAHPSMVAKRALTGGEPFLLKNVTESGLLSFNLPNWDLPVTVSTKGNKASYMPQLDTVVIEPDDNTVFLTWRLTFPSHKQFLYVDEVTIGRKRAA